MLLKIVTRSGSNTQIVMINAFKMVCSLFNLIDNLNIIKIIQALTQDFKLKNWCLLQRKQCWSQI